MTTSDTSTKPQSDRTFLLGGGRVSTTQGLAKGLASRVKSQVSFLSSSGAYAYCDPNSSYAKTFQLCLLPEEDSDRYSQSFTRAGLMSGGTVYQLMPLEALRGATELSSFAGGPNTEGLWPTPCADGDRTTMFKQGGMPLGVAVRMREPGVVTRQMVMNPDWVEWLMGFEVGHTRID